MSLFRGKLVHHAPVARKLSDRAVLIWGAFWTVISASTIIVCWFIGDTARDPLWIGLTITGIALTATPTVAVSRLDATLVFSFSPVTLAILYVGTDFGTAIAVWGTANLITLFIRIRHVGDAAEQLAYILGSAMVALGLVQWLQGMHGWRELWTVLVLIVYLAARFAISTIRLSVVTAVTVKTIIGAVIPLRAAAIVSGTALISLWGRSLQDYINAASGHLGLFWGGMISILIMGLASFIFAVAWTIKAITTQVQGIRDAALGLPWPDDKPITEHAKSFVKRALPHYEIEFRNEAGRNINEISSPMAGGHLIARRGNNQPPLLEADQLVLDSIAHIGDNMVTVRREHERLFQQTQTDTVTTLPNYRAFIKMLNKMAQETTAGFAVAYIDLDGFKAINDRYGHENGNAILQAIAERFREALNADEFVARVGGDEFVIILSELDSEQEGHKRIQEIFTRVCTPVTIGAVSVPIILSYGLSYASSGQADTKRLVEEADARMYEGREVRREGGSAERETVSTGAVARAIRESTLMLVYQPIVDTDTGSIRGLEALVRAGDSYLSGIGAEEIVESARREGLLTELSIYVVTAALADMARFRQVTPSLRGLHMNIDIEQVIDDRFAVALRNNWEGSGVSLTLELCESSLDRRIDDVISSLERLIATPDLHIALDDFGSSACSLESVIHYPFDVLKVDKAMIAGLDSAKASFIIEGIVRMGRDTDTQIIFEGVEDDLTSQRLRQRGARYMQGYRFGRPMLADNLIDRLEKHGLSAVIA